MLSMMEMAFHDTVPEGYDAGVEEGAGPDAGSDFGDLGDIGI
jgi:hypothetical protein